MLVRLNNEGIVKYWPLFKDTIRASVPAKAGEALERFSNVLNAGLTGRAQFWGMFFNDSTDLGGLGISYITDDWVTGQKHLHIYAYNTFEPVPLSVQVKNFAQFCRFGKQHGCSHVSAMSFDQRVAQQFCDTIGGTITHHVFKEI